MDKYDVCALSLLLFQVAVAAAAAAAAAVAVSLGGCGSRAGGRKDGCASTPLGCHAFIRTRVCVCACAHVWLFVNFHPPRHFVSGWLYVPPGVVVVERSCARRRSVVLVFAAWCCVSLRGGWILSALMLGRADLCCFALRACLRVFSLLLGRVSPVLFLLRVAYCDLVTSPASPPSP